MLIEWIIIRNIRKSISDYWDSLIFLHWSWSALKRMRRFTWRYFETVAIFLFDSVSHCLYRWSQKTLLCGQIGSLFGLISTDVRFCSGAMLSILLIKWPHCNALLTHIHWMPSCVFCCVTVTPLVGPCVFNSGLDFRLIRFLSDIEVVSVTEEAIPRFDSRQSG